MRQVNQDSSWLQTARRDTAGLADDQRQRFDALFDALENLPQDALADAAGDDAAPAWQPLTVQTQSLQSDRRGPRNPFAITFPQGMLWGLVGCLMGFASGFAQEIGRASCRERVVQYWWVQVVAGSLKKKSK